MEVYFPKKTIKNGSFFFKKAHFSLISWWAVSNNWTLKIGSELARHLWFPSQTILKSVLWKNYCICWNDLSTIFLLHLDKLSKDLQKHPRISNIQKHQQDIPQMWQHFGCLCYSWTMSGYIIHWNNLQHKSTFYSCFHLPLCNN